MCSPRPKRQSREAHPNALLRASMLAVVGLACPGCATIPDRQYGVADVAFQGVESVSPEAVEACLATRDRGRLDLRLGLGATECDVPPFDSDPPNVELFAFPWSEWPVYDPAIVAVDRKRIERWYHARGFFNATVLEVRPSADGKPLTGSECPEDGDCEATVLFEVEEGKATHVQDVQITYEESPSKALKERVRGWLVLNVGERFDEYHYGQDKLGLQKGLQNLGYARSRVNGEVRVDRVTRRAAITYRIALGPKCRFGKVRVEGADRVPADLIAQAASIPVGEPYSTEVLDDAQRAVFALGVFSSVHIDTEPGAGDQEDVLIRVRTGSMVEPSAGIGIMSGTPVRGISDETQTVPQWDVHMRLAYEHRNLFGGLQDLRIEERPRLIMPDAFPRTPDPRFGNVLRLTYEQPAFFDARTVLFFDSEWDFGPDAYQRFFRHDVALRVGAQRPFLKQRLSVRVAIGNEIYELVDSNAPASVSSYRLPLLEQQVKLDLRDDAMRPRRGVFASVAMQEALPLGGYGSWTYFRILPDARAYLPLPFRMVLAGRFALGALFIRSARGVPDEAQRLGPPPYRLRGGGANGNRGFAAGRLGAGLDGGIRRWEASLELRVPLGGDLGAALFMDAGDVTQEARFRFAQWNAAAGLGIRYYSILGSIRLDAGWRIPGLQRRGSDAPVSFGIVPSAVHLTIGEAF